MTAMTARRVRPADLAGALGLIESRIRRQNGRAVSVYDGRLAGLDTGGDGDPEPYSTVCEDHGVIISHATRALARAHAADPLGWCDECRADHADIPSALAAAGVPLDRIRVVDGVARVARRDGSHVEVERCTDLDARLLGDRFRYRRVAANGAVEHVDSDPDLAVIAQIVARYLP